MSDLVFIAFDNEKKAEEVRDKVLAMQREYLIDIGDAVIATRDRPGGPSGPYRWAAESGGSLGSPASSQSS